MSSYTHFKSTAFGLLMTVLTSCYVTNSYAQQLQWQPIEQVEQVTKKNRRKAIILVYTTWSEGYKDFQNNVLSKPHLVNYLNETFAMSKLDGEARQDINFKGNVYHYVTKSGVGFNELAAYLLQGQLNYPTLVFYNEDMNLIQNIQFKNALEFEIHVKYFGTNAYLRMPYDKFRKPFMDSINSSGITKSGKR